MQIIDVVICLGLTHGDHCFMYWASCCFLLVAVGMRRLPKAHCVGITADLSIASSSTRETGRVNTKEIESIDSEWNSMAMSLLLVIVF